jgi:hypothetical protein
MSWLQPLAWWGLVAVAAPILIHLLARHRSRRVLFPSLRFLQATQTAALRRRTIADWPLLIVRMLVLASATAALAGPVLVSGSRRASWNQRVARAIAVPPDDRETAASLVDEEARASFVSNRFSSAVWADALIESVEWLRKQPPAAREIVVMGDLRENALTDADIDVVPPLIGLRFLPGPQGAAPPNSGLAAVGEGPIGTVVNYQVGLTADQRATRARYVVEGAVDAPRVRFVADASSQDHAVALLRAVLKDGILLGHPERRVTLAFRGAPPALFNAAHTPATPWVRSVLETTPHVTGGEADGELIGLVDLPVTDGRAPAIAAQLVRSAFAPSLDSIEPRRISPATLARWSRAPGPSPADVRPADEGDRRWFWGAVLLLLVIEQVARGRRRSLTTTAAVVEETRVA